MMTTLIGFIIVLSVLIFVHELGHFWVAKRAGVRVEEFGIGFPPRLFSWRKGETIYSINLVPFGGFVKIFGEDEAEVKTPGSFGALSITKRAQVLVAGVIMNFLLAVALLSVVAGLGRPTLLDESDLAAQNVAVQIIQVLPDTPASDAGLLAGDEIIRVLSAEGNVLVEKTEDLQNFVNLHKVEEITLELKRQDEFLTLNVVPRKNFPEDQGPIGIFLGKVGEVASPWWRAPWDGLVSAISMSAAILVFVVKLFSGGVGLSSIAGPVGIATLTGDALRLGFIYLLNFTAFLSINLAILNILPFPALDGGRLVFLAIEKLKGSPVNKSIEHAINMAGFTLLILLMILVTYQDILRFL